MRKLLPIVGLLVVWTSAAFAQTPVPAPRRVEFDEAIQEALAKNPTVASAAVAIARAEALRQQARSLILPRVTAGITNVTLDAERGFDGGVTQSRNQSTFGASAALPLAPTAWAQVNQAGDQIEIARLASAEVRQQVAIAAAQAYLAVVAARRQVDVDTRSRDSARAHLDYADKRLQGGVGTRLNQLRAAQEVTADEARIEVTLLALQRAQEALGVLLAENGPVDAGADPSFEVPSVTSDDEAIAARPDVRVRSATIRAAERVVSDSWKLWLPTAGISFDPQYVTPSGLFQPSRSWRLTLSLTQRVFDTAPRAEAALGRAALSQARFAQTVAEIQARSEMRIARLAVESRQRAFRSARLSAEQANEVLRITTSVFEVGAATNLEVIDAQRSARDAETTAAQAEDAVRQAQLELLVATGRFPR